MGRAAPAFIGYYQTLTRSQTLTTQPLGQVFLCQNRADWLAPALLTPDRRLAHVPEAGIRIRKPCATSKREWSPIESNRHTLAGRELC